MEVRKQLGWGIASKPKVQNPKQQFLRQEHIFFESLDSHKDNGVVRQLTKTVIFIAAPMKKTHLAVYFCWQKSCGFNAKAVPACWRYKPDFCFFSYIR